MEEDKNKIIHLDSWRKEDKDLSKDTFFEEESEEEDIIPAFNLGARMAGNVFLTAAYAKGYSDGKIQKWRELRWHVSTLILSNLITIGVLWWALSAKK